MSDNTLPKRATGLFTALAMTALLAGPALAATQDDGEMAAGQIMVSESKTIAAPADEVWAVVRDFDAIASWHPAVKSSEISNGENNEPGAMRHLTLGDGGTINEKLTAWDDDGMQYSYQIVDGVLPVSNYESTIMVEAEGEGSAQITWEGQFDAAQGTADEDAKGVITNVYSAGLSQIDSMATGAQ